MTQARRILKLTRELAAQAAICWTMGATTYDDRLCAVAWDACRTLGYVPAGGAPDAIIAVR